MPMSYKDYHGKPEKIKDRAARNKARALAVKQGRVKKGDGKEVDHVNGNPRSKKTQILSRHANRVKQ